jgi:hypothetical protein
MVLHRIPDHSLALRAFRVAKLWLRAERLKKKKVGIKQKTSKVSPRFPDKGNKPGKGG